MAVRLMEDFRPPSPARIYALFGGGVVARLIAVNKQQHRIHDFSSLRVHDSELMGAGRLGDLLARRDGPSPVCRDSIVTGVYAIRFP